MHLHSFDERCTAARESSLDRADIQSILQRLGEVGGPEDVELNESDTALILANDRPVTIMYQQNFSGILLMSPIASINEMPDVVLIRFLEANASAQLSQGGLFGIPAPGQPLVYGRRIPVIEPDPVEVLSQIREFAQFVEELSRGVSIALDAPPEGEQHGSSTPSHYSVEGEQL